MKIIYSFFIHLYGLSARVLACFQPKAALFVAGRKGLVRTIEQQMQAKRGAGPLVWFHCASLGEFEQGRPLIEAFKERYPQYQICLTFFSPSGYEQRKHYAVADYVYYLPLDTRTNARRVVAALRPDIAIFVKYELWYYYLHQLQRHGVRTYLVSALIDKRQAFFKPLIGGFFRRMLGCYTYIFVQAQPSLELLAGIGVQHAGVAGDTRFDRVLTVAANPRNLPWVEQFAQGRQVLVAGSTWLPDEQLLGQLCARIPNLCMVVVPHEIDSHRIEQVQAQFAMPVVRYSQIEQGQATNLGEYKVLVVDAIGFLSSLYKVATLTYIGGGFGVGIHNTLEAAVYGKPVLFGPRYRKFREACELITAGAAYSITTLPELESRVQRLLDNTQRYVQACQAASDYVHHNSGATECIMEYITKQETGL